MSDLWEYTVNFYHLRLIPTVKRMLARRRLPYTLLTVGVFLVSATILSLFICHTMAALSSHTRLSISYENYLIRYLESGHKHSPIPEMRNIMALAKAGEVAIALLCGCLWLLLTTVVVGWVMNAVVASEAYVYGLYMIYGADRKQLTRQFSVEFILAGIPALALGLPAGFALYRLSGGPESFPWQGMLTAMLFYLTLIPICARILSAQVLKRPYMELLNTSDTSDITTSPRRSRLMGLRKKRTALAMAGLSVWRLRRHYVSLALAVILVTAPVFALLSPVEETEGETTTFTLAFAEGMDNETLAVQYLNKLQNDARIASLQYGVTDTAENLGIHILSDHAGVGDEAGLPLGERYITDSFRIACGDGDTFDELGGNLVIPEDRKHIEAPSDAEFGYMLDAVPAGCAVYVYPEGTTRTLSLSVGDIVKLYLPSENEDLNGAYITVRVSGIVAVPNLRGVRGGPVICPRITEDYLYLSPADYEKICGETHVQSLVAEEAYAPDLFPDRNTDGCILVIPRGNAPYTKEPSVITLISPVNTVKEPFKDTLGKESLPDDTYFINHTYKGVGVYMGDREAYETDAGASEALHKAQKSALAEYVGSTLPTMQIREYPVQQILYTDGGESYVILPNGEDIHFSALGYDLCAFRLKSVSTDTTIMAEEAYLLETDTHMGISFFGHTAYVGTSLLPDFTAVMKREGLQLQLSEDTFLHTKTVIRNSFTLQHKYYLLVDIPPFDNPLQPRLQADSYPRVITGTGSFCHLGNTGGSSIRKADELGIRGLFTADSIGTLRAQSHVYPGQYVYNDWMISPDYEAAPDASPEAGHAILFTPNPDACPIKAGDALSVALRQDTTGFLNDPGFMSLQLRGEDLLPYLLEHVTYPYLDVVVDEVRRGEGPMLALCEADLSTVLDTVGLHGELHIYLADGEISDYLDVYTLLSSLSKAAGGHDVSTEYDPRYAVRRYAASVTDLAGLQLMGILAVCIIPLLLAAAQFVFFSKRAEEFSILRDVGVPPAERRRRLAVETALTSVLMGLCAAAACPAGYLLLLILVDLLGVSLPAVAFDPTLCGQIALLSALSCAVAGLPTYLRAGRERLAPSDPPRKETSDL